MLEFLRGKSSQRKLRLFAVACCRTLFDIYAYTDFDEPLTWAEWYADGDAMASDLAEMEEEVESACGEPCESYSAVAEAVVRALTTHNFDPFLVPWAVVKAAHCYDELASIGEDNEQFASQCDILRDLFGPLPYRAVALSPAWLTPEIIDLARNIYDGGSIDRLATVGKELRDAGCTNVAILAHCRRKDGHVRGCWVIDLLLAKE
jgi:hypothetical protein